MKLRMPGIMAALACAATLSAETVTRRVTGTGADYDGAVRNGLTEAVRQVSGAALKSSSTATLSASDKTETSSDSSGAETSASSSVSAQTLDEKTDTFTKGVVAGYEVLSKTQDSATAAWHVEMDVSVAVFKTPGLSPDSRRKIAILPFKTRGNYPVGGNLLAAETVSEDMADRLITLFTQSRRFAVLSRQDDDVLAAEKDLIVREAPVSEMAKIGQTLGADYLLAGTVAMLDIGAPQTKVAAATGTAVTAIPHARMKVQYRIVVVGTGQVKYADDIFVDLDRAQLRAARGDAGAAYEMAKREISRLLAWRAISAIYPSHVVDLLDNGEVAFDEGGSLVFEGGFYDVFRLGAKVKSHSSGESLGRTEEKIATIQVTRVDSKMSYGRIAEGKVEWDDFDQGLIVRPIRRTASSAVPAAPGAYGPNAGYGAPAGPAGAVQTAPGGGVKLPFD